MNNCAFMDYFWHRLPIFLVFVNSYLVYRMLVCTELTHVFVQRTIQQSHGHIKKVILYILICGAFLSFFIPNAVTVLILIPILKQIDSRMNAVKTHRVTTALALSAIYGANIGGMGSLVGSPANLILIAALDVLHVRLSIPITFFNWFIWSIPLVIFFLVSAYGVIHFLALPSSDTSELKYLFDQNEKLNQKQKKAFFLFIEFICFWIIHSLCHHYFNLYECLLSMFCILFITLFIYQLLHHPHVLPFEQLIRGVPVRGFMVLVLFVGLMIIIKWLKLDQWGVKHMNDWLPVNSTPTMLVFWITSISILLTEFLSNTIVSTALFPIVYQTGIVNHISPILLMIPVSVASTCAFMTPIATPCNAFVFGEMKGMRLSTMFFCGFILNLLCILCVTFWIPLCIPLIYPS